MKTAKFPIANEVLDRDATQVSTVVGEFALKGLESFAAAGGVSVSQLIGEALGSYVDQRQSRPPGWAFPRFALGHGGPEVAVEAEVLVDSDVWERFENEAEAQDVTVEQLLGHALLVHLAALDRR